MGKTVQKKQFKLSVPVQDVSVLEWMEKQNNVSDSIRALIRADVEINGFDDVFCRPVLPKPKVGRPTNAEAQMKEQMLQVAQKGQEIAPAQNETSLGMSERTDVKQNELSVGMTPQPQAQVTSPVKQTDDDGFVDPEQLLSL